MRLFYHNFCWGPSSWLQYYSCFWTSLSFCLNCVSIEFHSMVSSRRIRWMHNRQEASTMHHASEKIHRLQSGHPFSHWNVQAHKWKETTGIINHRISRVIDTSGCSGKGHRNNNFCAQATIQERIMMMVMGQNPKPPCWKMRRIRDRKSTRLNSSHL